MQAHFEVGSYVEVPRGDSILRQRLHVEVVCWEVEFQQAPEGLPSSPPPRADFADAFGIGLHCPPPLLLELDQVLGFSRPRGRHALQLPARP